VVSVTDPSGRILSVGIVRSRTQTMERLGLERGPLSLVSTTEELLGRKYSGFCLENRENTAGRIRHADHVAPSIRKSWQSLRRQATVALSV
jgi:hypothetical protein